MTTSTNHAQDRADHRKACDDTAYTVRLGLRQLLNRLRSGELELGPDLPVFGGLELDGAIGPTWSWDATHALTGSCVADLEIVTREELATWHPSTDTTGVDGCPRCHGTGAEPGALTWEPPSEAHDCAECDGTGRDLGR